ncbi:MBL fold metallo-hydrolase [Comamonas sp. SY3]|jgi:recombination protein RecT|uniref:MBL fold metallo-hydrolase n=1 Tax=Comamonas sp. SY3 TaxID=3243601 RepID=UPI00359485E8
MTRTSQLLHVQREPAPARAAATALFLRDAPDPDAGPGATRLEVLMSRRSDQARFAAGHYVFPGGAVDASDAQHHDLLARRTAQTTEELTYAQAAIRESMEEMGVLLARHADGRWASQAEVASIDRSQPLLPQCAALGLTLAADVLWPLARWTAAQEIPIRFDVPFLVARMPQGQEAVTDDTEQFEPLWVHPAQALQRAADGQMTVMFPTRVTLERLAAYPTVQALLDVLQALQQVQPGQWLWQSMPRGAVVNGEVRRFMEHETAYGELALVCPDGQLHHALGWQSAQPVPLLKNVQRLTADNGGTMTGPGTNTYLVGDAETGYIVIDPGPRPQPQDDPHLSRIMAATGGDIRAIVCTHSHADHSPGAAPLQALVAQAGRSKPLIWGLSSACTARAGSQFTPDQELQDGQVLRLAHPGDPAGSHSLRVVHTPGHAANHVCLVLEEDGLLFSGDHILNGSTTVVDPPDGNMRLYLASLAKLAQVCEQGEIGFILPAHGYVLAQPLQVIAKLQAHRMAREEKVRQAMAQAPDGTPEDWVAIAYADTPERLWPVAKRSLLAHVEHIRGM